MAPIGTSRALINIRDFNELQMISAYAIPVVLALIAKGIIYYFARLSEVRNLETRLYLFFLFSLSIQNLAEITFFIARTHGLAAPLGGKLYFSASIMALALLAHLATALALERQNRLCKSIVAVYGYSLLLQTLLWFGPYLIVGFVPFAYTYTKIPGPLYFLFEIYAIGTLIGIMGVLTRGAVRQVTASKRLKNQILSLGLMPSVAVVVSVVLIQHFAGHLRFNTIATLPISMTFFLAVTWYATHQYRLFDIQFYWPWSKVKKRKTAFYLRIKQMIAELADLGGVQGAVDRLSITLHCPVALVSDTRPVLAFAGAARRMIEMPLSAMVKSDRILVANELVDTYPHMYALMRQHNVAAVVPFHPYSQYASGWLLLGEAFNEQVYSARDFALVEQLFDKMADLFLDKLLTMRAQLDDASRRIRGLERERVQLSTRVTALEVENDNLKTLKQKLLRQQAADNLITGPKSTTAASVVMLGRDKALTRALREEIPQVEQFVSAQSSSFRRAPLPKVVVWDVTEDSEKFTALFGRLRHHGALALYGSHAADIVARHMQELRGALVEVLPANAVPELVVRRVQALARLQSVSYAIGSKYEPLIGDSAPFATAIACAQRLAKFDEPAVIASIDEGQGIALAHAIHVWSGRNGRFINNNDAQFSGLSDKDTVVVRGTPAPVVTAARVIYVTPECTDNDHGFTIQLPQLTQRAGDAAFLIHYFTLQFNLQAGTYGYLRQQEAEELRGAVLTVAALKQAVLTKLQTQGGARAELPTFASEEDAQTLDDHIAQLEARIIQETLVRCGGNKSKAARLLGLRPNTLHYKLERYGLRNNS